VFAHLRGQAGAGNETVLNANDVRRAIIAKLRLDEVARRCPRGFKPFRDEIARKLAPLLLANEAGERP
jgi:hypothetical protein